MSEQNTTDMSQHFYRASAADFLKIPGNPVAYWVSDEIRNIFINTKTIGEVAYPRQGMATTNNDMFLRRWFEVDISKTNFNAKNRIEAIESAAKWFPYNKGGSYRKWYGNNNFVVNFENDGKTICDFIDNTPDVKVGSNGRVINREHYYRPCATWSFVSSSYLGVRKSDHGFIFDVGGSSSFPPNELLNQIVGILSSKVASYLMETMNPTLNFQVGNIAQIPFISVPEIESDVEKAVEIVRNDWDSFEASWDFNGLNQDIFGESLREYFVSLINNKRQMVKELTTIENEINAKIVSAYNVGGSVSSSLSSNDVTISGNLFYRYDKSGDFQELEKRELSDSVCELISYTIGCMMGRYSLDREGLVYAHAGNQGFADLVAEGAYKTFAADDDGILPLTEQEWFSDDVTNRLSEFVSTVWGEQQLEENLQFIADSLCLYALKAKKGERALDTIRRYLSNQFYKDHLRTYKRRPIYWLFSSGKHKAFECLVYLHRYHEGTLARMRAEYVIPLSSRINARINRLSEEADAAESTAERNQINRELKALHNQQAELATFDEQLRHHADMRISIDLDDGVKENYGKFGNLLDSVKAITGQAAE